MQRRRFFKDAGTLGAGSAILASLPARLVASTDDLNKLPEPQSAALVEHTRKILTQNLLKPNELFILATPFVYDQEYVLAMLTAAGEMGASGAHMSVFPKIRDGQFQSNLTAWHWDRYAEADLLITSGIGNTVGAPGASTAYGAKVGNHAYRTDMEYVNRPGSKTRWLALGGDPQWQRRYMPTPDRKARTLRGAQLLDQNRGEIRVTRAGGTDLRMSSAGRPGHAQYGIADSAGRWDNFGYGCVAVGPVENSAEGVVQLQPGDMVMNLYPAILEEPMKLTFRGGYATVEGGRRAQEYNAYLGAFNNRESYGLSHFGWGTHEATELSGPDVLGHYHHNKIGSLLFALGMNFAHGLGGREAGYSGLGETTRVAPNHSHFTLFGADVSVGGRRVVEGGRVSREAGGLG